MEAVVFKKDGKESGRKVKLNKDVFGIEPNDHAIYLDVKRYLAAQRQGTHKAKERAEITGSTRKIKKQKGTGTARAGSIKSPLFKGGGRVFGPEPRDYTIKLNKKVKVLARKSALSTQMNDKKISVVEDFTFDDHKTKKAVDFVTGFKANDKKVMIVTSELNKNLYLSSRNLKGVKVALASGLSTYDILNVDKILIQETAIASLENVLKS